MKKLFLLTLALLAAATAGAQIHLEGYRQSDIAPRWTEGRWDARWISVPGEPLNAYGVYVFRKTLNLPSKPERYVVHVSADNRYKLYVNGHLVSLGPARGDIYNWNYETVDLSPWLRQGDNTLAAEVWNFVEWKPIAQISFNQTGLIVQGNGPDEQGANTDGSWKCLRNDAYAPHTTGVYGYFAAGPGERVDASRYPWGWQQPDYDDSAWAAARVGMEGAAKGARDYPGRLLVPTPIPPMEYAEDRFSRVRQSENARIPDAFPRSAASITVPARTKARILLDNDSLTTAYLSLLFSGGRGSQITVAYAEALYMDTAPLSKGNRDEIEGKKFVGYEDIILPDGGSDRLFTSLWWRTWRYVQLTIETKDEPLEIGDVYGTFTAYPFERASTFDAPGHPQLNRMLDIGWRTARLCANETYMDCPYYEQLQYFGDTRIQALITLYNTRDRYMARNAIEQGRQSIVSDGITMSRYPSGIHQFISSFSLYWICMGHDYWRYRGEEEYLKTLLPAYRGVLSWYEGFLKEDFSLAFVPHWFFGDWASNFEAGEPFREKDGNSAFQDLLFVMGLEAAANMEEAFGIPSYGKRYRETASSIKRTIKEKYWDAERGLFSDTRDRRNYSQHVNVLAILNEAVESDEARAVMERTLADTTLTQTTIYFRYYLNQALKKAGLGDRLLDNMQVWEDQMALGLSTWAEQPEPSRSDCHAWGSSPNIEFFRTILAHPHRALARQAEGGFGHDAPPSRRHRGKIPSRQKRFSVGRNHAARGSRGRIDMERGTQAASRRIPAIDRSIKPYAYESDEDRGKSAAFVVSERGSTDRPSIRVRHASYTEARQRSDGFLRRKCLSGRNITARRGPAICRYGKTTCTGTLREPIQGISRYGSVPSCYK